MNHPDYLKALQWRNWLNGILGDAVDPAHLEDEEFVQAIYTMPEHEPMLPYEHTELVMGMDDRDIL